MKLKDIELFWLTEVDDKLEIESLTFKQLLSAVSYIESKDLDNMNVFTTRCEAEKELENSCN